MSKNTKAVLTAEEMLWLRQQGETFRAIGKAAGIGPMRASQIVRSLDPRAGKALKRTHSTKEFTGADIDIAVKDALRGYTQSHGVSISAFVAEAVEEKLKSLGVPIERTPINRGEPLPFEG